jgi:hypothetical protein
VRGLTAEADMSFKIRTAKVVSEFATCIGDNVEITVTDRVYQFRDPDGGHILIVLGDEGRFPPIANDLTPMIQEIDMIDRKTLLQRAKAFAGPMQEGAERLNLTFRGQGETASLHVCTPGNDPNEVTEDEIPVYREFPQREGQDPPEVVSRDVGLNREFLSSALDAMDGTSVKFKYCGRMILVEDQVPEGEEGETLEPQRSILLSVQQTRGVEEEATPQPQPTQEEEVQTENEEDIDDLEGEDEEEEAAAAAE